jgi:DNA polymerase
MGVDPPNPLPTLEALNRSIVRAPPMVRGGKRAVLGEGPIGAAIAFVGEQPGDLEDREGRPFVGPAGQVLNAAMAEVGIVRASIYLTNAVKHFKHEPRGKKRLHARPTAGEIERYRWWLERELDLVAPRIVVALGASAAFALARKKVAIAANRGPCRFGQRRGYLTVHPSYLLRLPDEVERRQAHRAFVHDLARVRALAELGRPPNSTATSGFGSRTRPARGA